MANKKISQLVGLGPYAGVSGEFYLPASAGSSTVPYATRRITTSELAEYVFSGDSVTGGFPATQLSGTKDVYLNKASWDTASTDVTTNPYIQVRLTDGKLITGSGMSVPSSAGDNMGNCTATTTLNMQDNVISNVGANIVFQDGGNIGSTTAALDISQANKISLTTPEIELNATSEIDINGSINARSADFAGTITGNALEVKGASYHNVTALGTNTIDWTDGNIQYRPISQNTLMTFQGGTPKQGQTLTLYVENTNNGITDSDVCTLYFRSGSNTGNVLFPPVPEDLKHVVNATPGVSGRTTNVYTFVVINTGIFGSSVTGYAY
tara:strand:- start:39 stop:1010 length:972 start_codon:yes stop_codon:yes gene_type:complete